MEPLPSWFRWRRWLVWLTYLALMTTALLVPIPRHPITLESAHPHVRFAVFKAVHVLAYALLAILAGWLRAPARFRWLLLFVVMAHGTATEL